MGSTQQEIRNLENEILKIEENISEFLRLGYSEGVKKSRKQLESNLKYLSILANGAPIEKNADRELMDFLRIHYDYLQKVPVSL